MEMSLSHGTPISMHISSMYIITLVARVDAT